MPPASRTQGFEAADSALWAARPDGSELTRINPADTCITGNRVMWSPDGQRLAFKTIVGCDHSNSSGSVTTILDFTTGATIEVPDPVPQIGTDLLAWSPDGTQLLVRSVGCALGDDTCSQKVGTIKAATGAVAVLRGVEEAFSADWSPDGSRLAFEGVDGLYVAEIAGGSTERLHRGEAHDVVWSPDGRWIAFHDNAVMRVVDADDGALVAADLGSSTQGVATGPDPVWSPDGRWLVWETGVRGGDRRQLAIADTESWGGQVIESPSSDDTPSWSPDGSRLAFSSLAAQGVCCRHVYVMKPDGTDRRAVTTGKLSAFAPAWQPRR